MFAWRRCGHDVQNLTTQTPEKIIQVFARIVKAIAIKIGEFIEVICVCERMVYVFLWENARRYLLHVCRSLRAGRMQCYRKAGVYRIVGNWWVFRQFPGINTPQIFANLMDQRINVFWLGFRVNRHLKFAKSVFAVA